MLKCLGCHWYRPTKINCSRGPCQKNPPVVVYDEDGDRYTEYPEVCRFEDACGSYQADMYRVLEWLEENSHHFKNASPDVKVEYLYNQLILSFMEDFGV